MTGASGLGVLFRFCKRVHQFITGKSACSGTHWIQRLDASTWWCGPSAPLMRGGPKWRDNFSRGVRTSDPPQSSGSELRSILSLVQCRLHRIYRPTATSLYTNQRASWQNLNARAANNHFNHFYTLQMKYWYKIKIFFLVRATKTVKIWKALVPVRGRN